MRGVYWVIAAGLLLKGIGATWDVAWHFRLVREAFSPPHAVNVAGAVLLVAALWYEWQRRDARRTGPLLVVLAGVALFLLAIPFDQWWHMRYGIDLTTWSPAHLMLFGGTAVSVFGLLLLFVADLSRGRDVRAAVRGATRIERGMLAFLLVFFAAAVYFPLTYNEYTTVAARLAWEQPELLDPSLADLARTVDDPVFHNTPRWLYPTYTVAMAAFVGTVARAWLGRGWALVALAGIAGERAVADAILVAAGWQGSALPLHFLALGAAIELAWLPRAAGWGRAIAGGVAATGAGYAWFVRPLTWAPAVPLTADSWPLGLATAVAAALLGLVLVRRGLRFVADVPPMEFADVRAWVVAHVARR